jgi:spore germination protein KB
MIENGKISPMQFAILVFMFSTGSAVLLLPSTLASIAGQDGWMSVLLSYVPDLVLIFLWSALAGDASGKSVVEHAEQLLGRWGGKAVGLMYAAFFLLLSALVLRNIGDFMTANILVQTPMLVVNMVFMVSIVYGAYLGLEVLARTGEILLPWVLGIVVLMLLLLTPDIHFARLLPVFPEGILPSVKGVYPLSGFPIGELVLFLFLFQFGKQPRKLRIYFAASMAFTVFFGILVALATVSVMGVDITARSTFAVFELAKEIHVGNFFERVEVLMGGVWIVTIFVKLALSFYGANLLTAQVFRLSGYRVTILPFGVLVTALSILVTRNSAEDSWLIMGPYPLLALFFGLLIPLVLLIISRLGRKTA